MSELQIRRVGYALGAEVTGIDLSQTPSDATMAAIRQAWLERLVLCFPKQDLTKHRFTEVARMFGEIDDISRYSSTLDPDNPNMIHLTNRPVAGKPWDGYKAGQTWHSDLSHSVSPALATLALARELPEAGGDTLFANQYMAYETLSPVMQGIVEGLSLVHDATYRPGVKNRPASLSKVSGSKHPPAVHPVVRVHPETGRKALYVGKRLKNFVGMTDEESQPLLDFLNGHATRYEFQYRHRWSLHDLIIWDNRCLLHLAPSDYDQQKDPRTLWRCGLAGPQVGRRYVADEDLAEQDSQTSAVPAG